MFFFLAKRKPTQELFLELFYSPHPNNITFQKNIVFFVFVRFLFFWSDLQHLKLTDGYSYSSVEAGKEVSNRRKRLADTWLDVVHEESKAAEHHLQQAVFVVPGVFFSPPPLSNYRRHDVQLITIRRARSPSKAKNRVFSTVVLGGMT